MKKEKHKWIKEKHYIRTFGKEYHIVEDYYLCEKCGAIKIIR